MAYETMDEDPLRVIELLARDEIDDEQQMELYRHGCGNLVAIRRTKHCSHS